MKRILFLTLLLNSIFSFAQFNDKCKDLKEKEIIAIIVMDEDFEKEINTVPTKGNFHLLVKTRNYEEGEEITLEIEENSQDKRDDDIVFLSGIVDKEGYARLEEQVALKNKEMENSDKQDNISESEKVYKTYKGKDYTEEQWKGFEQKQWENHQWEKKNKGFFDLF